MANHPKISACTTLADLPKDSGSDEVKLNGDDEALVKPEIGSTEQAGVEPKVKSNGYVAMLSVGYRF